MAHIHFTGPERNRKIIVNFVNLLMFSTVALYLFLLVFSYLSISNLDQQFFTNCYTRVFIACLVNTLSALLQEIRNKPVLIATIWGKRNQFKPLFDEIDICFGSHMGLVMISDFHSHVKNKIKNLMVFEHTVESRYLELEYLEF